MRRTTILFALGCVATLALASPARADVPVTEWRVGVEFGPSEVDSEKRRFLYPENEDPMWVSRFSAAAEAPLTGWFRLGLGAAYAQRGQVAENVRTAFEPEGTDYATLVRQRRDYFELLLPATLHVTAWEWRFGTVLEPLVAWRLHVGEPGADRMPAREISARATVFAERWHVRVGVSYLLDARDDLTDRVEVSDRATMFHVGIVGLGVRPEQR